MKLGASDSGFTVVTWSSSCLYSVWARGGGQVALCYGEVVKRPRYFYKWYADVRSEHGFCSGKGRAAVVEVRLPTSPNSTTPNTIAHRILRHVVSFHQQMPNVNDNRVKKLCSGSSATKSKVWVYDWCSSDTGVQNSAPWWSLTVSPTECNTVNREIMPIAATNPAAFCSRIRLYLKHYSHSRTQNVMR